MSEQRAGGSFWDGMRGHKRRPRGRTSELFSASNDSKRVNVDELEALAIDLGIESWRERFRRSRCGYFASEGGQSRCAVGGECRVGERVCCLRGQRWSEVGG
jgi:hypothetical protein